MSLLADISPVAPEDYPRVVEVWEASVRATHHFVTESDIEIFRPLVFDELPHTDGLRARWKRYGGWVYWHRGGKS
jgi:hypothetical protein